MPLTQRTKNTYETLEWDVRQELIDLNNPHRTTPKKAIRGIYSTLAEMVQGDLRRVSGWSARNLVNQMKEEASPSSLKNQTN